MLREYCIKKYIKANSIKEAIKLEFGKQVDEVVIIKEFEDIEISKLNKRIGYK